MTSNQKGFGVLEVILLVFIVGSIGILSWYVYHAKQVASSTYNAATDTSNQPSPRSTTRAARKNLATLSGSVTQGPISPAARPADANVNATAVTGHMVRAKNAQNKVVGESKTDAQGKYVLHIPPGNYTLDLVPKVGMGVLKNNTVQVTAGTNTFDLVADTGIR